MTREQMIEELERQQGIINMTKFKCSDCGEEIWYRQFSKNDTFECKCKPIKIKEEVLNDEKQNDQNPV